MKFFLPHAESQEQADQVSASIRSFLSEELRAVFDDRKIFRLTYRQQGTPYAVGVLSSFKRPQGWKGRARKRG